MHINKNQNLFTTRLLNGVMGDITLGWTEDQSDVMEELIQKKMDEGYTFFIIDSEQREVRLRNIADVKQSRSIIIGDKEAEALIFQGKIGIVEVISSEDTESEQAQIEEQEEIPTTKRAKTAKEAAKSSTVAVPNKRGG